MSKWQLPTQKGTTVFPQVTTAPTKVRFDGVPAGSDLAKHLYRQFAPQINHFHRAQAQKYSLSTIENYRAHGTYPGLKMTYTNLQGQETVQITVTAPVPTPNPQPKPKPFWDWVQIDIDIPNTWNVATSEATYGLFHAVLVRPTLAEIGPADVEPFLGVAGERVGYPSDQTSSPVVQYPLDTFCPYPVVGPVSETTDHQTASLLIDVRGLHDYTEIKVDLYGNLTPLADTETEHVTVTGTQYAGEWNGNSFVGRNIWTEAEYLEAFPELAAYGIVRVNTGLTPPFFDANAFALGEAYLYSVLTNFNNVASLEVGNSVSTFYNQRWDVDNIGGVRSYFVDDPNPLWSTYSPEALGIEAPHPQYGAGTGTITWRFAYWAENLNNPTGPFDYDWGNGTTGPPPNLSPIGPADDTNNSARDDGSFGYAFTGAAYAIYYYMPTYETTYTYEPNPISRTCTMRAAIFKGTPPWVVGWHIPLTVGGVYYQWDLADKFPTHIDMTTLTDELVISNSPGAGDGTLHNHYDMTFLGSIFFYQQGGAVVFRPA